AQKRGLNIDTDLLARRLGLPVVPTTMKSGRGKKELLEAMADISEKGSSDRIARIDYGEMEPFFRDIVAQLSPETRLREAYPLRWLAIKLMEGDAEAQRLIRENLPQADAFMASIEKIREAFEAQFDKAPELHIATCRYKTAADIAKSCTQPRIHIRRALSNQLDRFTCHKLLGPAILVGVIWLLYYLSIVQGYNLTNYTWPLLATLRSVVESLTPAPGFIEIPLIRAFSLWFVDSINALLNYIPIFFILFGLIAILEDSGYMPRMAFIMDQLFSRFGLHGQSTLPMVLGGIYVGG
ncbi:MAG: nucleoside recognition domain-containing protein, partial [Desulfobacteraceae bacterium]